MRRKRQQHDKIHLLNSKALVVFLSTFYLVLLWICDRFYRFMFGFVTNIRCFIFGFVQMLIVFGGDIKESVNVIKPLVILKSHCVICVA